MILAGIGLLSLLLTGHLGLVRSMEDPRLQESSDAYLRNVVNELHLLNGLASTEGPQIGNLPSSSTPAARLDYQHQAASVPQTYRLPPPPSQVHTSKSVPSYSVEQQQHRQVERSPARNPMILGFTPAQLASMYKKAIERGVAVKYQSLVNTIGQHSPKIFGVPPELAEESHQPHHPPVAPEPHYAYYFYPLQSFRHELADHHGYHTVPNFQYSSAPTESTKKETSSMNPVLVGISSFLGMALFFMLSLFFYPRFMHFMHFPFVTTSRGFNGELTSLASFVTEAVDYYNDYARMKRNTFRLQRKS